MGIGIKRDLTEGSILKQLIIVAMPVILTSFIQMLYNLTDLLWLGRYDSSGISTSAAGFGGFYIWLAAAIIFLTKIGTEVKVAQRLGRDDDAGAKDYAKSGIQVTIVFGVMYALLLFIFTEQLIGFFDIKEAIVIKEANVYLGIISYGILFHILNEVFAASINGTGNTIYSLVISAVGLVLNMVLDPILIISFDMGVEGAAVATSISHLVVTITFIGYFLLSNNILHAVNVFKGINYRKVYEIVRLGLPVAIQSAIFTFISMIIARLVADFGAEANAVQKIGSQVEALSWRTATGIQTALSAFIGQNYGAEQWRRLVRGYLTALFIMVIYGLGVNSFLFFGAESIFRIFIDNPVILPLGIDYLKILSLSQVFMIIEITTAGAFNGLGKTTPPSIVGVVFNFLRIPLAIVLSYSVIELADYGLSSISGFGLGLNGIWWSITISSVIKGLVLLLWFILLLMRHPNVKREYFKFTLFNVTKAKLRKSK